MITATDFNRQGLGTGYKEGVVVNNDETSTIKDPEKRKSAPVMGRVQIRVDVLFDGIADEYLPWAVPESSANANGASSEVGSMSVPEIGYKVLVRFQDGSPLHPLYRPYIIDSSTYLVEARYNYPDRDVTLLENGSMIIIDKKDNMVMIRLNGNTTNLYVTGNCNISIDGDATTKVNGDRVTYVGGDDTLIVKGDRKVYVGGSESVDASSSLRNAPNCKGANEEVGQWGTTNSNASVPPPPTMPLWKSVRGKKPDRSTTDPITEE